MAQPLVPSSPSLALQRPGPAWKPVIGEQVDYHSKSFRHWIPASIKAVDPETGAVHLDVKPTALSLQDQQLLLRPRTRPEKRQLAWVRAVLREGRVDQEAKVFFDRHATAMVASAAQPHKWLLRVDTVWTLAADIDVLLGISGSIVQLYLQIIKSATRAFCFDSFVGAFWDLLSHVQDEYGSALPEASSREAERGKVAVELLKRVAKLPERSILYNSVALSIARVWLANTMPSVKRAFHAFSETGDGRLTTAQTAKFLWRLNIAETCALKAADAMDLDRDGSIDWTEFVAACICLGGEDLDKALWEIFCKADSDGDNLLSQSDLGKLLPHDDSGEVAKDVFRCLTGRTEPGARVDWPTFRMHFKSVDAECGAGGTDADEAVGVAQSVALAGLALGPECFKQAFDAVEHFGRGFFPTAEPQQQQQQRRQQAFPGLQQQLVETTAAPNVEVQEQDLKHLAEMGFSDREMCVAVLQRHRNELTNGVIEELCNK